jgi:hypothetical protein
MNLSEIELPSNRKFGFFFSGVFLAASIYFFIEDSSTTAYSLVAVGVVFLITTILRAEVLSPLNKLWMRFGLLIGMVVSPIVMGVIFFGLFTLIGIAMRLFGRDELRLHFRKKKSHWIPRNTSNIQTETFKNQF